MRQGLMDLYGVRYVICTKETGAKLLSDYRLLRSKDGMQLYENKNVFPFGYTYDGYLSSQTYKTLNPAQKEQALLQSAILEDDSKSADKLKKMTIPENVTSHVVGENYRIHSEKEKEKIIQIKIPKQYIKANSYIYLQGVSTEALDGKSSRHVLGVGMNKSNFQLLYGGKQVHLFNAEKNSSYDIGKRNYLVKMSRDAVKDREDTLTLKFKLKSDYYIDRISILTVDQQTEIKQIQKRKKADHLTNISYDGGNHFSGDIKASQNEILCIPITYHKGWKAYDNGKQVKSEQVNGMFEGIYLNKGDHHITLKYETVLIFDEVITGFRLKFGGAQEYFGVKPDMTTLGKIVGGGMPIAAYGGKKEIMDRVSPTGPVYQAGTLSGNPIATTAGIETLKILKAHPEYYKQIDESAKKLADAYRKMAKEKNIPLHVNQIGSLLSAFQTGEVVDDYDSALTSDTNAYTEYFWKMLDNGIYVAPAQFEAMFVSVAHTKEDIERTCEVISL